MARKRVGLHFAAAALLCAAGIAYAGYGDDRALIEDLQARYMFAFDYGDPDGYSGTFTPDGTLDYGGGEIKGRKAIADFIAAGRKRTEEARAKTPAGEGEDDRQRRKRRLPGNPALAALVKPDAKQFLHKGAHAGSFPQHVSMAGVVGFELTTPGFGDRCSAN